MKVDQATIIAENLEFARHFFCAMLGLSEGPRPPFSVNGQWLYANGHPVIHLIEEPALCPLPDLVFSRIAQEGLDRRRLSRVVDYIEANLEGDLTVDRLAGIACLSRFHFARAFKAAVGRPPHQYVSAKRLERAKALLIRGDHSLIDIALTLSFSCQANFTRAFRHATGVTPGQYRRSFGLSDENHHEARSRGHLVR